MFKKVVCIPSHFYINVSLLGGFNHAFNLFSLLLHLKMVRQTYIGSKYGMFFISTTIAMYFILIFILMRFKFTKALNLQPYLILPTKTQLDSIPSLIVL